MKLLKLTLGNFQGIKSLTFEPNGNDASVYGTNAAGKTTLYNALTWLLFDKASTGEKGFSPKTKGADGKDIHNMNNRVEGTFALDDGTIVTFSKDLHEKWTKKRGANTEEFTGNETDYFIDSVPVSKSEYESSFAQICSADMAQILTQPTYFPESMSWQNRRKILLEVCGDVTEYDVINSSRELNEITQFLLKPGTSGQFYTVEEYQKMASAQRKDINTRLEKVPDRIDEAAKAIPDITGITEESVNARIQELQAEKDAVIEEKAALSATDADQSARIQMADINTKIAEGRAKFNESKIASLASDRERISKMKNDKNLATYQVQAVRTAISRATAELNELNRRRERLATEYKVHKEAEYSGDTTCPTCKQPLPEDQVESARAEFNKHKSNEMERLRGRIETECSKKMISDLEQTIKDDEKTEAITLDKIQCIDAEIQIAEEKIKPNEQLTYEGTEEYAAYAAQIAEIKANAQQGDNNTAETKRALQAKIDGIQERIGAEQQKLLLLRSAETQQKRVEELEAEEKQLNRQYERLTQGLYLCEEFIKTKVRMLNEKINGKFESVQFRLFETQINGGIKEDCEVMIPTPNGLVPFSTANNAARINAGLEIIDTLARHWGVTIPVFVDNAESVVAIRPIASQVIRLVVSEADETLRTEMQC